VTSLECPRCRRQTPPGARCSWCRAPLAGVNRARKKDPETAHVSARRSSRTRSEKDQAILDELKLAGSKGRTTLEISHERDLVHNNMSSRMVRLEERGLIHRTGAKRISNVPPLIATNHESQVWYYGPSEPGQAELAL